METCDVIIVGGGPAGSSCAWKLRDAGLEVVVVDRASFPRDKVCAGWITPAVVEELQLDLADYRRDRILQPITGFVTGLIGGGELTTALLGGHVDVLRDIQAGCHIPDDNLNMTTLARALRLLHIDA